MSSTESPVTRISNEKTIQRIDGLVNKLALAINKVKTIFCLLQMCHEEDQVTLFVRKREGISDNVSECDEAEKEEGIKAMLSYNSCIMVVQYFAGLVAFLVEKNELPVTVSEDHIFGVVPQRTVVMKGEGYDIERIARRHTMMKFTSSDPNLNALCGSHGVYSDASSWQYWREQGLCKVSSYPMEDSSPGSNYNENSIGTEYYLLLKDFAASRLNLITRDRKFIQNTESRIRALNNALYNEIIKQGGPKYISSADDTAWQQAEQHLVNAATEAVWQLEFDREFGFDLTESLSGFGSSGHLSFVSAIDRASGLGLVQLLFISAG